MSEEGIPCNEIWGKMLRLYANAGILLYEYLLNVDDKLLDKAINRLELVIELIYYGTEKGCMKDTNDITTELEFLITQIRGKNKGGIKNQFSF
jgi:hypothetical protein